MPLPELCAAVELPEDIDADTVLRDMKESIPGFEGEPVRQPVTEYQSKR